MSENNGKRDFRGQLFNYSDLVPPVVKTVTFACGAFAAAGTGYIGTGLGMVLFYLFAPYIGSWIIPGIGIMLATPIAVAMAFAFAFPNMWLKVEEGIKYRLHYFLTLGIYFALAIGVAGYNYMNNILPLEGEARSNLPVDMSVAVLLGIAVMLFCFAGSLHLNFVVWGIIDALRSARDFGMSMLESALSPVRYLMGKRKREEVLFEDEGISFMTKHDLVMGPDGEAITREEAEKQKQQR